MDTETDAALPGDHRAWGHWLWVVIPMLLVVYVLGMAPFNAWCTKRFGPTGSAVTWRSSLNAPLFWVVTRSETTLRWSVHYQGWWNRQLGLPYAIMPDEIDDLLHK